MNPSSNSSGAFPGRFKSQWIADALSLPSRFERTYATVTSDSRKSDSDSLFVALPGEKFDGHDFIAAALDSGARGILVSKAKLPKNLPADVEVFAVEDTLEAYRTLAQAWRKELRIPFILVAGSVGKTTTKELLAAVLRGKWPNVVSTEGSQNGYIGIPMTLLAIPANASVAVVEVGIDEPGAMTKHLELVHPTHALLTAIGAEHLERLIDLETVAREEGYALEIPARNGATVVVRMDDPWIRKIADTLPSDAHAWTCALGEHFDGKVSLVDKSVRGEYVGAREALRITMADGSGYELAMPLPGAHNAGNLLVAVTMAAALELSPIEIQRGLSGFRGAYGRSELRILPGKTPVLCDYYNANPSSVEAGLDVLASVAEKYAVRNRIAVLGDMLELGQKEEEFHRGLAKKIAATGVSHLYLYGERMRWLADEIAKTGGVLGGVQHFTTHDELADALAKLVRPGDALLVKGSRGMRMEEVWKKIEPLLNSEASTSEAGRDP
jgi:UDP-N-acetylmuramoyl-tripeptide--D-alanyl-D-alanine ligase